MILPVMKHVARNMQPTKGCKLAEFDTEDVVLKPEGLSDPKTVVVAGEGSLVFTIAGGEPDPVAAPDDDDVVGVGVGVEDGIDGDVDVVGVGVEDGIDGDDDDDDG